MTDPIDLITQSLFTTRMFGRGYDCREVDEFLDTLVAHLRLGAPVDQVQELIDRAAFTESRGGYHVADVDELLDQVVVTMRRGDAPYAGSVATALRAPDGGGPVAITYGGSTSALIPPRKSLLARFLGR